ncbi:MAG: hypothetical protein K2Q17_07480 [Nitrospiraceae bacterium]|nr:hypothetical protein [Nitrospiraceae bacterium]
MTIVTQWIQRGVLCSLLLGGVVGCSIVGSPPVDQVAKNDHAGLANWYDKQATDLRQRAKDMADMKAYYAKNPGFGDAMTGEGKRGFGPHCDSLIGMYNTGAEEADQLAKMHRGMTK